MSKDKFETPQLYVCVSSHFLGNTFLLKTIKCTLCRDVYEKQHRDVSHQIRPKNTINRLLAIRISTMVPYRKALFELCLFVKIRADEHLASHFVKTRKGLLIPDIFQKLDEVPQAP